MGSVSSSGFCEKHMDHSVSLFIVVQYVILNKLRFGNQSGQRIIFFLTSAIKILCLGYDH
ncbi:hypothetical protein Pint_28682 [Pistacia integerrima]|uniref:Uncharacterized protein n=1 Tax=Pistacia integerrima TaxID=434235 RepID=A0ACC0YRP7_9ROSI|nr:hypothetical protein Pint_28682 [Pistacia integerrima]